MVTAEYLTCTAGSNSGDGSAAESNEETTSNFSSPATQHPSHVAVPVVYNRRMLYLHAVCLACLGALPEVERYGGRGLANDCVQTAPGRNKIACRFCSTRWTVGECLVLGTMYTYDVFACSPCCATRRACRRCGGPPVVLGGHGPKSSGVETPASFSDCSRLAKCSWCGLEDYHFVKTFDDVFVCAQRSN